MYYEINHRKDGLMRGNRGWQYHLAALRKCSIIKALQTKLYMLARGKAQRKNLDLESKLLLLLLIEKEILLEEKENYKRG